MFVDFRFSSFFFDFRGFSQILVDSRRFLIDFRWWFYDIPAENTKTVEYRAAGHEIKNFWYQSIDLFTFLRMPDTREPETPIQGGKKAKKRKTLSYMIFNHFEHLNENLRKSPPPRHFCVISGIILTSLWEHPESILDSPSTENRIFFELLSDAVGINRTLRTRMLNLLC